MMPGVVASTIYTAPSAPEGYPNGYATSQITEMWLVNTSSAAKTVTIGINGISANNQLIPAQTIPAFTSIPVSGIKKFLNPGDTIQALQETASAITVHIDGVEVK